LYIPFLHFTNSDADLIRMLISYDGGRSFHWSRFNIPGAPDENSIPTVQVGTFTDCGSGGVRNVIHTGTDLGGGRFGLPRFMHSTRLVTQPAIRVVNGTVYLAWNASTSPFFGDPTSGSNILFLRSKDHGRSWSVPIVVNPPTDYRHFHPAMTISRHGTVSVAYYTQHKDGSIDVDMANSDNDGDSFPATRVVRLTTEEMELPPTLIPIPTAADPNRTQNYDRLIQPCYALGEYMSLTSLFNKNVYALWGDSRNLITEPDDPFAVIKGTHPQEDVFFQALRFK